MNRPQRYQVTVDVEAWQVDDKNCYEVARWCGGSVLWDANTGSAVAVLLMSTSGQVQVSLNHWIIKGTTGEFFARSSEFFNKTYEVVHA